MKDNTCKLSTEKTRLWHRGHQRGQRESDSESEMKQDMKQKRGYTLRFLQDGKVLRDKVSE